MSSESAVYPPTETWPERHAPAFLPNRADPSSVAGLRAVGVLQRRSRVIQPQSTPAALPQWRHHQPMAQARLRQPSVDLGTQHLLTVTMLVFSQIPVRAA